MALDKALQMIGPFNPVASILGTLGMGIGSLFGDSKSVALTPEEKVMQGLGYLANQQNALRTSGPDQDMQEGSMEALSGNEETLKELINEGMALGMTQAQLNPAITSAVGPIPTSGAFGAPPQETSALMDLVREAGGRVVEGTADLGNLVAQAITLGQGPKLEAVIPNILDIIRGNVGGTLVFGGGQNPVPVVGTGQTGIGAGTNVGLNVPILGPAISAAVDIYKQGGTLTDVMRSIPGALINNVPQVLSGVAAAGLLFDEKDKDTLVNLGVDPVIIKTQDSNVGGAGVDPTGGAGTDTIAGGVDSAVVKTGGVGIPEPEAPKIGGVGIPDPETIVKGKATDVLEEDIKTIIGGGLTPIDDPFKEEKTQIVKTGEEVKTSTPPAGAAAGATGVGNLPAGGGGIAEIAGEPGELVEIENYVDMTDSLDAMLAQMAQEEDEDELPDYPYSGGGAVKRFSGKDDSYVLAPGASYGPDPAEEKGNIFTNNLPAIIGGGIGALFGLTSNEKSSPSGYQGGIPEYKYNRSLAPDAFSTTNADGTPRRPGSAGRSYFTQGTYDPVMETFTQDGEEITQQRTLGGAQRRADEAAMAAQAAEEEDYIAQIGQDFLDLQPVDTGAGAVDTGVVDTGAGTGVVDTGAGAGAVDTGAGTGVVDTGASGSTDQNFFYDLQGNKYADQPGYKNTTVASYLADGSLTPFEMQNIQNMLNASSADGKAMIMQTFDAFDPAFKTGFENYSSASTTPTPSAYDLLMAGATPSSDNIGTVVGAIESGEANIPQVAGKFDVGTLDVAEDLLRNRGFTPADVVGYMNKEGFTEEELIVRLLDAGKTTVEEVAGYYGKTPAEIRDTFNNKYNYTTRTLAQGGALDSYYLGGTTDGMADEVPATIGGNQPAALSDGEFVVPADVVSHLGNGNSDAGATQLYSMMDRVRKKRTGTTKQGTEINPMQQLPA